MTTLGIDWASVDGNGTPTLSAAKSAGAGVAIVRAVYGRGGVGGGPFIDPTWAQEKDAIRSAGLLRSAYLFVCVPQAAGTTPPPEEQADAFIAYVSLTPHQDLVPFFDVEEAGTLSSTDYYAWISRVAVRLQKAYGAWPGMYTSARVWAEYLGGHPAGPLLSCPLWLAKPWPWLPDSPAHLDGAPSYSPTLIPEWGTQWFGYQYQGDAKGFPGFSSTVDISRWRVVKAGESGQHVQWIQERLGIVADGIYGQQTFAAVRALQEQYGLQVDGEFGPQTFAVACWDRSIQ